MLPVLTFLSFHKETVQDQDLEEIANTFGTIPIFWLLILWLNQAWSDVHDKISWGTLMIISVLFEFHEKSGICLFETGAM
ncbi:MAG: hypothetical protein ACLU4N_23310 [Butyricimonas faecihominis]